VNSILQNFWQGQVEDELTAMNFERVGVYRPAFLLCDRREPRPFLVRLPGILMKPAIWAFPTSFSVPTDSVAKVSVNWSECLLLQGISQAIIESMHLPLKDGVKLEIYENPRLHELACGYDERYGVKK